MDRINICFSINDKYAKHCAVAISSILKNTNTAKQIFFYVIYTNLNPVNKFLLKQNIKNKAKINFLKIDKSIFKNCHIPPNTHFSLENFYRLKIASILNNLDKVLYLDSDILVLKDIEELYNTNIENNYLACVQDMALRTKIIFKKNGFCNDDYIYFNSGVLLINLKKWKKENIENQLFNKIKEDSKKYLFVDQDCLNQVLGHNVKHLDFSWNTLIRVKGDYDPVHLSYIKDKTIDDFNLIHFAAKVKPWQILKKTYYSEVYYKYLKLTPWQKFEWFYELKRKLKLKKLELEKKNKPKKDVEKLNNFTKDKKVILWGASLFLKDLINTNKLNYTNILGVVDKNPDLKGQKIGKTKIISLEDIATLNPDCIISTAIKHPKLDKIIEEELKEKNINIPVEKKFFKPIKEELFL